MSLAIDTRAALTYFKHVDPIMHDLLKHALAANPPLSLPVPKKPNQYFANVASSIISQQISTKAADAVRSRVIEFLGELTPERVKAADFDALKACGLSNQKTKYIKHNAEVWRSIPSVDFVHMTDQDIITELTKLYGIGRWTAEMFLMFSLARPDVFSYGDLGLMQSLYQHYHYKPHYNRKIAATVDSWSPHRTLASLSLWFHKDNGPVLL